MKNSYRRSILRKTASPAVKPLHALLNLTEPNLSRYLESITVAKSLLLYLMTLILLVDIMLPSPSLTIQKLPGVKRLTSYTCWENTA